MRAFVIAFVGAVLATAPLEAQKRCVKGKPCGNSCIAANKTCRTSTPRESRPTPTVTKADAGAAPEAAATSGAWVASSRGTTFYKAGCSGAKKLSVANRIYFKSEDEAAKARYHRSAQKGC